MLGICGWRIFDLLRQRLECVLASSPKNVLSVLGISGVRWAASLWAVTTTLPPDLAFNPSGLFGTRSYAVPVTNLPWQVGGALLVLPTQYCVLRSPPWLLNRELNPDLEVMSLVCYHCTIQLYQKAVLRQCLGLGKGKWRNACFISSVVHHSGVERGISSFKGRGTASLIGV